MRKLVYVLFVLISTASYSQSYKTAVGLKGGYPGYGSLNIKHYINGSHALEGSIGGSKDNLWVQGLYEINKAPPTDGLNWYFGIGPNIGFVNSSISNSSLFLSASGVIGIEYTFQDLPINIALDTGPAINIIPAASFGWGGGIAVRYTLK